MTEFAHFILAGFLRHPSGRLEPFEMRIDPPTIMSEGVFACEVRSSLLHENPHLVRSRLSHDAWAKAFELIMRVLRLEGKPLVDKNGEPISVPSPPRDRACVEEESKLNVKGIDPIFRVAGWTQLPGSERRRIELAIWPPFEQEHGIYCAPMRCGLRRNGEVMCSYGASPEQALYLAHRYLQIEVEHRGIMDDQGRPIEIPVPPEPPLPPP